MGSMRVWIGSLAHSPRRSECENDACSRGQRSCKNPQQFEFYLCSMSMFAFRSVAVFTLCANAVRIPTLTPHLFCNTSSHERIAEPRSSRVHGHCVVQKPLSFSRVALVCGVARRVHLVQQGWCELWYRKSQPAVLWILLDTRFCVRPR